MARIRIKVYFTLPERLGWREKIVEIDGDELRFIDLLGKMPDLEKIYRDYEGRGFPLVVMINGRRIEFLGGENAILRDGDEIAIFPPAAGG